MIISASRRTDIPAFYSEWLLHRLGQGMVLVPHPRGIKRIARVPLNPEGVDCLVFWSKNPGPMLGKLDAIEKMGYRFFFTFTLTPYGARLEPGLPPKEELEGLFLQLSARLGPQRVDWRYDPVLVDGEHTVEYHLAQFARLCRKLHGATTRCILSFADPYAHLREMRGLDGALMERLAAGFAQIAGQWGLPLFTCAEGLDLGKYGIRHGACIDRDRLERLLGYPLRVGKDPGQRPACGCAQSVDIGAYDTCGNGCGYCYATRDPRAAARRLAAHDPRAPMLTGYPKGDEIITDKVCVSCRETQATLWGF